MRRSISPSPARRMLPNAVYNNQFIYTQGGAGLIPDPAKLKDPQQRSASLPRFIANNAVHEYLSQASVTENIGLQQFNAASKASAALSVATAELEVARRGLVASVVGLFYTASSANRRIAVAQRAANEAASLTTLTQQRETAREVAHADVVKAQLQQQQRDRDLTDARLDADSARLDLGVLLFPDPRTPYTLAVPDRHPRCPRAPMWRRRWPGTTLNWAAHWQRASGRPECPRRPRWLPARSLPQLLLRHRRPAVRALNQLGTATSATPPALR